MGPTAEEDQDLFVSDLLCRGSVEWNITKIMSTIPHLLTTILRLKPSITGASDSYVWLASKSGQYSAKSGYFVAAAMNQVDGRNLTEAQRITEKTVNKEIWASKVSPKMQLFI